MSMENEIFPGSNSSSGCLHQLHTEGFGEGVTCREEENLVFWFGAQIYFNT